MNFNSHLHNSLEAENSATAFTPEDIAALTHYPSLDKLFQDKDLSGINAMKSKLQITFQNLERVVLRGSENDSRQAKTAVAAVKNALDFLAMLEQTRNNKV